MRTPSRTDTNKKKEENCDEEKDVIGTSKKSKCKYHWKYLDLEYTPTERKTSIAELLSFVCKILLNYHVYNFGGKITEELRNMS